MSTYSHSQVKMWRRCQKAWEYKYRHDLVPRRSGDALVYGKIVHKILEKYYHFHNFEKASNAVWEEYRDKYFLDEIIPLFNKANDNVSLYLLHWHDEPLTVVQGEMKLEVPFGRDTITGYIDGIVVDHRGHSWLLENKTGKQSPGVESNYWDLQTTIYHKILKEWHGYDLSGTMWVWLTSGEINQPRLLKNGTLSRALSQRTNWTKYVQAIDEYNLDIEDYLDLKDHFEARDNDFFKRVYLPYEPEIADQLYDEFKYSVDLLADAKRSQIVFPRNMERHCSWCNYQSLCKAEFHTPLKEMGGFIEKEYEKRDYDRH